MNMVINYCLDYLDFDAAIGYKTVAAQQYSLDTIAEDGLAVASMVAAHFAVSHVSHYSLFFIAQKHNGKNKQTKLHQK